MEKPMSVNAMSDVAAVEKKNQSEGGELAEAIKSINLVGSMVDVFDKILAYRTEVKRLEAEKLRINQQAAVMHAVVDKTCQLKLGELLQRQEVLQSLRENVRASLQTISEDRKQRAALVERAFEGAVSATTPEQRAECRALLNDLNRFQLESMDKSRALIDELVTAIPAVDISPCLLEAPLCGG